jgi:hypothetical protein
MGNQWASQILLAVAMRCLENAVTQETSDPGFAAERPKSAIGSGGARHRANASKLAWLAE